ncbi:unnamed protein product [Cercospora beticola]|nr:unnamed protein product [Cercospora beticola]
MAPVSLTALLLLSVLPAALAADNCYCNDAKKTYHACNVALNKAFQQESHGDPKWRAHWSYVAKVDTCYYEWSGDPKVSPVWNFFNEECGGAHCDV